MVHMTASAIMDGKALVSVQMDVLISISVWEDPVTAAIPTDARICWPVRTLTPGSVIAQVDGIKMTPNVSQTSTSA